MSRGGGSLATGSVCPRCGASVSPGFRFCNNCGSPLVGAGPAPSPGTSPPYGPPPGFVAYPPPYGYPTPQAYQAMVAAQEARKRIDWTKIGLLLLFIGIFVGWAPYIGILGYVLIVIGGFLVIFGRRAFGPLHSRNVMLGLGLVIGAIVASIAMIVVFIAVVVAQIANQGPTPDPTVIMQALAGPLLFLMVGFTVVGGVGAVATLVFTYALQDRIGQYLLWGGLAANAVINVLRFFVYQSIFASLFSSGITSPPDPFFFAVLGTGALALTFAGGIPAVINGAAYYLAWARINRGEIPPPTPGQVMPVYPAYPASPPTPPG